MSDGTTEIEVAATGLLPEAPEGAHHREPSARERMMESIVAKVNRQREEELGHVMPDVGPTLEESTASRPINHGLGEREEDRAYVSPFADDDDAAEPAAPVKPAAAAPATPAAPPQQPAAPQLITVNVGGQNLQVTQEQLVHLAQIGMIANQTVAEFQQAQQQPNFYQQQPAAPQQPQQRQAPTVDRERVRETVKRIQYGTEESAAEAMADLIGSVVATAAPATPSQQVDPAAIQRAATQEALRMIQLQRDTEVIKKEYPDIMSNSELSDLAARQVVRLRDQLTRLGRTASDLEIYREAGNRVLDLMGRPRPAGTPAEQPAMARSDDQTASQASRSVVVRPRTTVDARKREAPRSTSQVLDRRSESPQPRIPTHSDIVAVMRKERGQTPLR